VAPATLIDALAFVLASVSRQPVGPWWLRFARSCSARLFVETGMTTFAWSQVLAAGAFVCGMVSYQLRDRRQVLLCLTALATLNAGHFLLLDRTTPAVMLLLTATRYVTAMFTRHRAFFYLYLAAAVVGISLSYSGPLSWLALAGVFFGTFGSFQQSDRAMRQCFFCGNSCWITHNVLAQTPVAIVMEICFFASNVVGYWRLYGRKSPPTSDAARDESDIPKDRPST
jgi:hypothetical protein